MRQSGPQIGTNVGPSPQPSPRNSLLGAFHLHRRGEGAEPSGPYPRECSSFAKEGCRGEPEQSGDRQPQAARRANEVSQRLGEGRSRPRIGKNVCPSPQPSPRNSLLSAFDLHCRGEGAKPSDFVIRI